MKKSEFTEVIKSCKDGYNREIDGLTGKGPGKFSKKVAEDLKAGFADGARNGAHHLLAALGQSLEEG